MTKPDGTVVRTLWGELAWQLVWAEGPRRPRRRSSRIQADDERATSPGDVLRELMNEYGPCSDPDRRVGCLRPPAPRPERPAGRQLRDALHVRPGAHRVGQADAKNCLLVISLPASDTTGSPHAVADDVEVGGERGRAALEPAAQRGRARRGLVAAGERRGRVRDRAPAAVRATGRAGAVRGARHGGPGVLRLLPDAAAGVPAGVPGAGVREAAQGRIPDPPGDLRSPVQRLVHAGEVPADARRVAADGGGDPLPVGEGRQEPAHPSRRRFRSTTRGCSSS